MKLLEFTDKDLDQYIELAHIFHSGPASFTAPNHTIFKANFDHIIDHEDAFGWFIESEGEIAGYVLCSLMFSTEVGGMALWVEELSVQEAFQEKGLGTQALESLIELFPEILRFRLEVAPDNKSAKALYQRLGYDFLMYEQMIFDRK